MARCTGCLSSGYAPTLRLMKNSFGRRSREYLRETSFPVLPYLIDPAISIFQRSIWLVIFVGLEVAVFYSCKTIWNKFQTSPTLTYLFIDREDAPVDFPNVYLCFDESHLNFSEMTSDDFQNNEKALRSLYRWYGDRTTLMDIKEEDGAGVKGSAGIFHRASPECGEFFTNCKFGENQLSCDDAFRYKIVTPDGICCEFKSKKVEKDDHFWGLQFQSERYPLRVQIGGKDEGPTVFGQQPAIRLSGPSTIDLSLDITTTAEGVRFLSQTQRKCVFPEEGESHVECERKVTRSAIKSACGCLPWFYAESDECPVSGYECVSAIPKARFLGEKCYLPCEHTAYKVERIERSGELGTRVRLLLWPDVRYQRVTRFGWLDLVVAFGGVAGSFIGYSIVSNFELLYYFTLRVYCGAVLSVPKIKHNVQSSPRLKK